MLVVHRSCTQTGCLSVINDASTAIPVRLVTLVASDVTVRNPFFAGGGLDTGVRVHHVYRLERKRFRFEQEEEDHCGGDKVAGEEDKAERIADTIVS
jgi:hypothetical protein